MFKADFYSQYTQPPLRYIRGRPVYLATIIAALHVMVALLTVFLGNGVLQHFNYVPLVQDTLREPWRLVTWAFAEKVGVWLLMSTLFTYLLGRRFEMWFGPKFLAALYLGLILTGSGTALLLSMLGIPVVLSGESITVTFALFAGTCFLEPDAPFFGIEKFPLKYAGLISLGLGVMGYAADRDWGSIVVLQVMLGVIYGFLRNTGMPARFGNVKQAFKSTLPSRRLKVLPAPVSKGAAGASSGSHLPASRYYEPKIKPKPDLAPERKVVEEIDGILEKIARSGMASLSASEKAALTKASDQLKDTND